MGSRRKAPFQGRDLVEKVLVTLAVWIVFQAALSRKIDVKG